MGHTNHVGRVGGLAVALGIGAALVSAPWSVGVAAASPNTLHANSSADTNNTKEQNMAISTNGQGRVQKGSAVAFSSGPGSVADAKGSNTLASANGDFNHAKVDNKDCGTTCPTSQAIAGGFPDESSTGVHDTAIASGQGNIVNVTNGNASRADVTGSKNVVLSQGGQDVIIVKGLGGNTVQNNGNANNIKICGGGGTVVTVTGNGQTREVGCH